MPEQPDDSQRISVRVSPAGIAILDDLAKRTGITSRSDIVRTALRSLHHIWLKPQPQVTHEH